MEREIIFTRIDKGTNKETKENYYYIEYLKADGSYRHKKDYISAIQYATLEKKTKGKELQKLTAILGCDDYDRLIVVDIK